MKVEIWPTTQGRSHSTSLRGEIDVERANKTCQHRTTTTEILRDYMYTLGSTERIIPNVSHQQLEHESSH